MNLVSLVQFKGNPLVSLFTQGFSFAKKGQETQKLQETQKMFLHAKVSPRKVFC